MFIPKKSFKQCNCLLAFLFLLYITILPTIFKDFEAKIEDFWDFWKIKFSKYGVNNAFYVSDYDQISFCNVVQVQSFPIKCVVTPQIAPNDFYSLKRAEVVIFSWFQGISRILKKIQLQSSKKCFTANVTVWVQVRAKKFWNDFRIQNLLSKTCLGPWESAE